MTGRSIEPRKLRQLFSGGNAQLGERVVDMGFHRMNGQVQLGGNLTVGRATSNLVLIVSASVSIGNITKSNAKQVQIVAPPEPELRFLGLSPTGVNALTLRWQTSPGRTYHVQFKTSLNDSTWLDAGPVDSTGSVSQFIDQTTGFRTRYYRIVRFD